MSRVVPYIIGLACKEGDVGPFGNWPGHRGQGDRLITIGDEKKLRIDKRENILHER